MGWFCLIDEKNRTKKIAKKEKLKYLRIIKKEDLFKRKLVTDKKGNTKEIITYPKKVLL